MTSPVAMRGEYADTRVGRLHYREAGAGPVLVLIHGGQMDSSFWLRLAPALADRYRTLAIDWPPSGFSDAPDEEPSDLAFYGDAVIALLDALDVERASLVGFHIGASIAVAAAAAHGARVEKLALIGLLVVETQEERDAFRSTGFPLDDAAVADPVRIVRDFEAVARSDDPDWYAAHLIGRLLAGRRSWWAYRALFSFDVVSALRAIAQPTLIVHLEQDAIPIEIARQALDHLRDAEWLSLDLEPYAAVTEPARLAAVLTTFLEG